jgi:hypothetical protein
MTSNDFNSAVVAWRQLFWPNFVEHDDCVFRVFEESVYRQWLQQTGGDKTKAEAVMNHLHVLNVLPASVQSPTRDLVVAFGRLLQDAWSTKLRRDFPGREFCVDFPSEELEDLLDYEITFYQSANKALHAKAAAPGS